MYNKLFSKIIRSSIWLEPDQTLRVWVTLIATMDETGFCEYASVANLAHIARVSLEDAKIAVGKFEGPDPDSSDPDNEGRRIERVPGGWMVLNAGKHHKTVTRSDAQEKTRERVRRFRERKRSAQNGGVTEPISNASVTPETLHVTVSNDTVTLSDTDTDVNTKPSPAQKRGRGESAKSPPSPLLPIAAPFDWPGMPDPASPALPAEEPKPAEKPKPPTKTDLGKLRHAEFKAALWAYWVSQNPTAEFQWGPAEGRNLDMWLRTNPNTTMEQFRGYLENRCRSEGVCHSDPISVWIGNVTRYAAGPLDRFNKPLKRGGYANGPPSPDAEAYERKVKAIMAERKAHS